MRRRSVLGLAALASLAACDVPAQNGGGGNAGTLGFTNRLRIPELASSEVGADGVRRFKLAPRHGQTPFRPGQPAATAGYNRAYLGPTLRARRGEQVTVEVHNQLDEVTTVHWHGMRVPARMDGGPHQPIEPGGTWSPAWTVDQPAATLWYHPHPHGATAMQVYRGLAGLFLIDDEHTESLALPSEYGVDDIPLIVQDKRFAPGGALDEEPPPGWGATFGLLGEDILVNGTHDPLVEVSTTLVRFRILNASNARMYHLGLRDRREFHVVATDGGLLPQPVATDEVQLSPAERVEIVVEFRPGERVELVSLPGDQQIDSGEFDILRIAAAAQLTPSEPVPETLGGPLIEPASDARVRTFTLSGSSRINSKEMDPTRIDEVVPAGAREIWELDNIVFAHNFHIHEVAFRLLDLDGSPPPAYLQGPKDTVFVPANTKARIAVEFGHHTDLRWPYLYHCHILFHEDRGMMGQFLVVEPGTEAAAPDTIPAPTHQHD